LTGDLATYRKEVIDYRTEVNVNGFAVIPDFIDSDSLAGLIGSLALTMSQVGEESCVTKRGAYAIRNLLQAVPSVTDLATCPEILGLARQTPGANC
jgi:hypothetical protein